MTRASVTCGTCRKYMPNYPEPRIAYDIGIVQDAGDVWHVYQGGHEILSTPDREWALRALKRAVERELAGRVPT
mgnify:CR=1 FL=1